VKQTYSVAFETTTVDIWEVDANNQNEATMLATIERQHYLDESDPDRDGYGPTHSHVTKMKLLPVKPTVQ
jgi:hypothetical protein